MEDSDSIVLRLLLVGDADVGKTSILSRFAQEPFADQYQDMEQKTRMLQVKGKPVNIVLVDTAGQERFRTLTSGTYRGIDGIYICYDVTKSSTFNDCGEWLSELKRYAQGREIQRYLIGNKVDLLKAGEERQVTEEQGQKFASENEMEFLETSAKDDTNIEKAFMGMVERLVDAHVSEAAPKTEEKKGCCVVQ